MLTQGQAMPMGGTPQPMPADPSMAGGMPMDPAMMGAEGGMPPEAAGGELPPEAMAMLEGATGGATGGQITLSVDDLIRLVEGIIGATKTRKAAPAAEAAGAEAAGPAGPGAEAAMPAGPGAAPAM